MVKDLLKDGSFSIEGLWALEYWVQKHIELIQKSGVEPCIVSEKELKKISTLKSPNQVFTVIKQPRFQINEEVIQNDLTLYLENIQNPGNLGTIIRIADWFGIPYIFCSQDCVDVYNSKVIQASMSAFLSVKVIYINFDDLSNRFSALPIIATTMDGEDIFEQALPKKGIIIIGNEGNGISKALLEKSDFQISIPSHSKNKGAESLNAAIATGIICAQFRS